jgi:transposase
MIEFSVLNSTSQTSAEVLNMAQYVGLDVHRKVCHATVVDEHGEVIRQGKFLNTREGIEEFFDGINDAEVAMEACYCWQPVYELLERDGYKVKLSHPLKTRIIAEARIKTDANASEALAHLLRTDLLPTSYVPSRELRELRELVRLRTYMVRERTRFKNKIHAELAKRGIQVLGNPFTKRGKAQLKDLGIRAIDDCLAIMGSLNGRIQKVSGELKKRACASDKVKLLMTIPGVGYSSALTILAEVGDVSRFGGAEKLCSYAGLVPSVYQSGNTRRSGRITKQGSGLLRWMLEECVWMHLRHANDTRLTRFFHRIARRRGRNVAASATARKLLVAIYWMLVRKEEFHA